MSTTLESRWGEILAQRGGERLFGSWLEKRNSMDSSPKLPRCQLLVSDGQTHTGTSVPWVAACGWRRGSKRVTESLWSRTRGQETGRNFWTHCGSWQERTCGSSLLSSPVCPLLSLQLATVPAPCCVSHPPPPLHARHGEKSVPRQQFPDPLFSLPSSLADPLAAGAWLFLRTQRGCGPGPGTIVKTSLSTFDPPSLSSPSDPWLYHNLMVLYSCP